MFDLSELEAARESARLHLEALHDTREKLDTSRTQVRMLKTVITELKADLQCAEDENRALRGQR